MTGALEGIRIQPVDPGQASTEVAATLAGFGPSGTSPFFRTMANNSVVLPLWGRLVGGLLDATLPARDRELLILRTAHHCRAAYPWAAHERIGREAGLSEEELARIRQDDHSEWGEHDAALLTAADELHCDARISDQTWDRLRTLLNTEQMVEVPVVVGFYHLNAFAANTLDVGVEAKPGMARNETTKPEQR